MTETPKRLVHLCVANHTNATGPSFASYTLDPSHPREWPGDKTYEVYARILLDAEQPTAPAVSTSTTPTPPTPVLEELNLPSRDLTLKEIVTLHDFHAKQMTVLGKRYASAVSEMYRDDLNREGIPHHAGIALRALSLNKRVCKLMKKRAGGLASLGFEVKREKARVVSGYTMQSGSDTGSDSDESESDSDSDSGDGQDHLMYKYVVTSPLFL